FALEQLHRVVRPLVVDAEVERAHDVRMLQLRECAELLVEQLGERLAPLVVAGKCQALERDRSPALSIARAVNGAHAALAEQIGDLVALRARRGCERRHVSIVTASTRPPGSALYLKRTRRGVTTSHDYADVEHVIRSRTCA